MSCLASVGVGIDIGVSVDAANDCASTTDAEPVVVAFCYVLFRNT